MSKSYFKDKDTVAEIHAVQAAQRAARADDERWLSSFDLLGDEVVAWEGRPAQGLAFTGWDVYLIPLTLLLAYRLFGFGDPSRLLIGAVVFYGAIGRFIVDLLHRRQLRYVITNKRVMIVSTWPTRRLYALRRLDVGAVRIHRARGGCGTIRFDLHDKWYGWSDLWFWLGPSFNSHGLHACFGQPPALFRIRDADRVYALLRASPAPVV